MTVFVINHHGSQKAELQAAVERQFPDNHHKVSSMTWFVSYDGTAEGLCDYLRITKDKESLIGRTLVVAVSGYYGVEPVDVWEWLRVNWPGGPHGD